jgi:predicted transcriptional regulator
MKVAELMQSEVTSVRMEDRVGEAVALLSDNHLSALPGRRSTREDRGSLYDRGPRGR